MKNEKSPSIYSIGRKVKLASCRLIELIDGELVCIWVEFVVKVAVEYVRQ